MLLFFTYKIFNIDYDPQSNQLLIENMERINELTGSNQEETNDLRKSVEELINTTIDMNEANADNSASWYDNTKAIRENRDQLIAIRQEQADNWLGIREHENSLWDSQGGKENDIIFNYRQMMDYVHNLAEEYRSQGLGDESEYIQSLQKLWWEYYEGQLDAQQTQADNWLEIKEHENDLMENQGGQEDRRIANYEQMMEYVHNLADEYRSQGLSDESEQIRNLQKLWWEYYDSIKDINEDLNSQRLDSLKKQQEGLNDIIDLTEDMIKQEQNDIIDALNDEIDAYSDIVSLKKKSLELTKQENDYQDNVDSLNSDINELQSQIDTLSLDDSREAQAQRAELLEQLADKQKELTDTQADYSLDQADYSLDEELDSFTDTQNAKISEIKEFLSDNQALNEAAMQRIDEEGDALFDSLLSYALTYTDTTESELLTMWENAKNAVEEYGSAVAALESIDAQVNVAENGSDASEKDVIAIVFQMKTNSAKWSNASDSEKKILKPRMNILHL